MVTLLFLGAGASQQFDIPTMRELVDKFEKYLTDNNIPERFLYSRIKNKLLEGYQYNQIDIEAVFSIIEGIASETGLKQMGYLPYYYVKRFFSEQQFTTDEIKQAKNLQTRLQTFIQEQCSFKGEPKKEMELFKMSYEFLLNSHDKLSKALHESGGWSQIEPWRAYTTNYDQIFEDFCEGNFTLDDFFSPVENSKYPHFLSRKSPEDICLIKLHGSLDWFKLENNKIIKSPTKPFTKQEVIGKVMLYPIQQKDLYRHPWFSMFQDFKRALERIPTWIVIGYAFNDPFILDMFIETFTKDKRMLLINPEAKTIREKFPHDYHDQIILLPIKFGNKYFVKDAEDFSEFKRTLEIRVETKVSDFSLHFSLPTRLVRTIKMENFADNQIYSSQHDGLLTLEFHSENMLPKQARFDLEVRIDYKFSKDLEITIKAISGEDISLSIYNQDRFMNSSYIPENSGYDSNAARYVNKTKFSAERFFVS